LRVEGLLAIALAIAACGLTAAMWLRQILPVVGIQI
jgi:EamA domain-containing membrane protein RarD